jgi:hypothetical protein
MLACSALGELGFLGEVITLLVTIAAFGYGVYQRRGRNVSDAKVAELAATRRSLEAEIKVMSLRPPPIPIVIQAPYAPLEPSAAPAPTPDPNAFDAPPDETLG